MAEPPRDTHPRHSSPRSDRHMRGVRAVAAFELSKGAVVLVAGFGLLSLVHRDAQEVAEQIVRSLHLNPASHLPRVFVHAASRVNDGNLKLLAGLALFYSLARFVEGYGLWRGRVWAEWFAVLSGAIYLPVEMYELAKGPTVIKALLFVGNSAIVAYLVWLRIDARRAAFRETENGLRKKPSLPGEGRLG